MVLTGGIAAGKTAVSDHFSHLGASIVDTDRIAHEIVEPGQPALERIKAAFGPQFLDAAGRLDRRKMRDLVFADARARARLEAILHPLIAEEALRRVKASEGPYCILVIPLFADRSGWAWIDRVVVVDVPESVQIERVMTRDRVDRAQARAILSAQPDRSDRLALADDVIDNRGSLEALKQRVKDLHRTFLKMARERHRNP